MKGLVEARIFTDFCSYKLVTRLTQLCGFVGGLLQEKLQSFSTIELQ